MNENFTTVENSISATQRAFTVTFFGDPVYTTLTSSASVVRKWIYRMWHFHRFRRHRLIVGLGVQWRPSFIKGVVFPAATLQLCIGRHCLIFQLLHRNATPQVLLRFLADPSITFVGVWNGMDAPMLHRDHGLKVETLDLRFLAAERKNLGRLRRASMETLASAILGFHGVKKPTRVGTSRWDANRLSVEQVQYACVDAHLSFELGRALDAWKYY